MGGKGVDLIVVYACSALNFFGRVLEAGVVTINFKKYTPQVRLISSDKNNFYFTENMPALVEFG